MCLCVAPAAVAARVTARLFFCFLFWHEDVDLAPICVHTHLLLLLLQAQGPQPAAPCGAVHPHC